MTIHFHLRLWLFWHRYGVGCFILFKWVGSDINVSFHCNKTLVTSACGIPWVEKYDACPWSSPFPPPPSPSPPSPSPPPSPFPLISPFCLLSSPLLSQSPPPSSPTHCRWYVRWHGGESGCSYSAPGKLEPLRLFSSFKCQSVGWCDLEG